MSENKREYSGKVVQTFSGLRGKMIVGPDDMIFLSHKDADLIGSMVKITVEKIKPMRTELEGEVNEFSFNMKGAYPTFYPHHPEDGDSDQIILRLTETKFNGKKVKIIIEEIMED
jgi:hypothetical protein